MKQFKRIALHTLCIASLFFFLIPRTGLCGLEDTGGEDSLEQPQTDDAITPEQQTPSTPQPVSSTAHTNLKGPENTELPEEVVGVQGNWIKKKEWLKQTQERNCAIQTIYADIQQFQKVYYEKFRPIDDVLNDFYRQSNFDKSDLEETFEEISKDLEATKEKNLQLFTQSLNKLTNKEKETAEKLKKDYLDTKQLEENFKTQKTNLEQLKLHIKSISELDEAINSRLKKLEDQIAIVNNDSEQAKKLCDDVWYVIDDKKARKIYYDMDTILERMKSLQKYLKVDLLNNFESTIKTTQEQITQTKTLIDQLEKQGVVVMNRTARLEAESKKQAEIAKLNTDSSNEQNKNAPKSEHKKSFIASIINFLNTLLYAIKLVFISLYESMFGSKPTPPVQ